MTIDLRQQYKPGKTITCMIKGVWRVLSEALRRWLIIIYYYYFDLSPPPPPLSLSLSNSSLLQSFNLSACLHAYNKHPVWQQSTNQCLQIVKTGGSSFDPTKSTVKTKGGVASTLKLTELLEVETKTGPERLCWVQFEQKRIRSPDHEMGSFLLQGHFCSASEKQRDDNRFRKRRSVCSSVWRKTI